MSGTRRSLADLYTLLADNAGGDISAQDVRDVAASVYGSGLEPNAQTITTANVTGAVGQMYVCTIAGLTANRDLTLPAGTVGDRIGVYISDGDDTFALVIKGAASVTINGGTAATEWSRLFIQGECVTFFCVAPNTWIVEGDGRIPQMVVMQRATAQTGITESTDTEITGYATPTVNNASIANTTTGRVTPRRLGSYQCSCRSRLNAASAAAFGAGTVAIIIFKRDNANDEQRFDQYSIQGAAGLPICVGTALINIASIGSYISAFAFGNDPTQSTTVETGNAAWNFPKLVVYEVFR
jgi:hypothetical protein